VRWSARLLVPLVLAVSACTREAEGTDATTVRDSAGILGTYRDADHAEHVRLHRLDRR
jgi:hypothetical protein